MNPFTKQIAGLITDLKEISAAVDLLKRERDLLAKQNEDLRHRLKKLKAISGGGSMAQEEIIKLPL